MNEYLMKQRAMMEGQCAVPYQPSMRENLLERRNALRAELDKVEAALKIFETEPRVADALETIMKAMR